jgi:hypothetical protein
MDFQTITGWENSFQRQEEFLNDLFAKGNSVSHEKIGSKLVERGILRESEKEIFLKHLRKKLSSLEKGLDFHSENQLLLICIGIKLNDESLQKAKTLVNADLNWNYILKMSSLHRIAPLLYQNLKTIDKNNAIPQSVMGGLRKAYQANRERNKHFYKELAVALKAFKDAGIEVIVLKGAALAKTVYQNFALRQMGDIDLLVREENQQQPYPILESLVKKGVISSIYHFEIESVHHDITMDHVYNLDLKRIWQDSIPAKIAGCDTSVLAPEDCLLSLCVAFCRKGFGSLRLLHDIMKVLEYNKKLINWDKLIKLAKESRLDIPLYTVFTIIKNNFTYQIPDQVIQKLTPGFIRIHLINWLINKEDFFLVTFSRITEDTSSFLLKLIVSDKMILFRRIIHFFFPESSQIKQKYKINNRIMLYFHYLIHPVIVTLLIIKLSGHFIFRKLLLGKKYFYSR